MEEIIITRTILKAGVINANGYMYDKAALESLHGQLQHHIDTDQALGYFAKDNVGPITPLSIVSHKVVESNLTDDTIDVKIKILDTPHGQILAELLKKDQFSVSFRPRGTGIIDDNQVVTNFSLSSINVVPSQDDLYKGLI